MRNLEDCSNYQTSNSSVLGESVSQINPPLDQVLCILSLILSSQPTREMVDPSFMDEDICSERPMTCPRSSGEALIEVGFELASS